MARMTRPAALAAGSLVLLATAAQAEDNVRIVRGAGVTIEMGPTLSKALEDIRFAPQIEPQVFRSQEVADLADWIADNPGTPIQISLQADDNLETPGGLVRVARAAAIVVGTPPPIRGEEPGPLIDIDQDGAFDLSLWRHEEDIDAMIVTVYDLDAGTASFVIVEPAPRVDENEPFPPVFIPTDPEPGYSFSLISEIPIPTYNIAATHSLGETFFRIPARALSPVAPGLTESASITLVPGAGPCNAADLAEPLGALDFSDVVAFLGAFGAMDPAADLAFPVGVFDFTDVVSFLDAFGAGCP